MSKQNMFFRYTPYIILINKPYKTLPRRGLEPLI